MSTIINMVTFGEKRDAYTLALNEWTAGKWTPPVWKPSAEIEHCIKCHGPEVPTQKVRKWNQQGHMEYLMCHEDHTI